jgi:hypothetical protein
VGKINKFMEALDVALEFKGKNPMRANKALRFL